MVRRLIACLVALLALAPAAASAATSPVRLAVALHGSGRPGASTALDVSLRVDTRRLPSPVSEVSILTPRGLEVTTSDLGIATCDVPPSVFAAVVLRGVGFDCPANAVLGVGRGVAEIRLSEDETIVASGVVTLYTAPSQGDHPGVAAYVVAQHPVRAALFYAGYLFSAPAPYGLGLRIAVATIPKPPLDAVLALRDLHVVIGSRSVLYRRKRGGRTVLYHPAGIPMPASCPRRGFPFQIRLRFVDGGTATAHARASCSDLG